MSFKVGDIVCISSMPYVRGTIIRITNYLITVQWDHLADILLYTPDESRFRLLSKLELALYEIKSKED